MEMCPEVQSSPAIHASQQNRSILIDSSGSGGLIERSSRVTGGPHTQSPPRILFGLENAQHAARKMMQKQGCIFSRSS